MSWAEGISWPVTRLGVGKAELMRGQCQMHFEDLLHGFYTALMIKGRL